MMRYPQAAVVLVAGPADTTENEWKPKAAFVDSLVGCLFVASTLCVFERWRRRRWQFGLRALMALVTVAAIVTLMAQHEREIVTAMDKVAPTFVIFRGARSWLVS